MASGIGAGTAVLRRIRGSAWAPFSQNLSPGWNRSLPTGAPPPTNSAGTAALMSPIEVNALSTGTLRQLFFFFLIYILLFCCCCAGLSLKGGEWDLLSVVVLGLLIAELGL